MRPTWFMHNCAKFANKFIYCKQVNYTWSACLLTFTSKSSVQLPSSQCQVKRSIRGVVESWSWSLASLSVLISQSLLAKYTTVKAQESWRISAPAWNAPRGAMSCLHSGAVVTKCATFIKCFFKWSQSHLRGCHRKSLAISIEVKVLSFGWSVYGIDGSLQQVGCLKCLAGVVTGPVAIESDHLSRSGLCRVRVRWARKWCCQVIKSKCDLGIFTDLLPIFVFFNVDASKFSMQSLWNDQVIELCIWTSWLIVKFIAKWVYDLTRGQSKLECFQSLPFVFLEVVSPASGEPVSIASIPKWEVSILEVLQQSFHLESKTK